MKKYFINFMLVFFSILSLNALARSTGLIFDDAAYDKVLLKAPLTRGLYRVQSRASLKNTAQPQKAKVNIALALVGQALMRHVPLEWHNTKAGQISPQLPKTLFPLVLFIVLLKTKPIIIARRVLAFLLHLKS